MRTEAEVYDDAEEGPVYGPLGPFSQKLADQEASHRDNDGRLNPGDEGYWPIWGACARDIRPGDLVLSGWKDNETGALMHAEYEVVEMASFKQDLMNSIRVGFIDSTGTFGSVGMMQPCSIVRWGTGNFLSDYAR